MIFQSKSQEKTKSQTVLSQDTTMESATLNQKDPALLKVAVELSRQSIGEELDVAHTILARDCKGLANQYGNGVIEWK